jgi:hypothetical protein
MTSMSGRKRCNLMRNGAQIDAKTMAPSGPTVR